VPESWIIDASPLIILARIARLDWFERLPSTTLVPQAVIREIAAGAGHDPSAPGAVRWATSRAVADLPVPASIAHRGLGDGEAQVITHGQSPERLSVLDDRSARTCARAHGVRVIGTLGVILLARKNGLIARARPWVDRAQTAGLFLDPALVAQVLSTIGE